MIVQTLTTKRCQKVVKPVNHEPIMTKPYREKNKSHKLRNFLQSPFNLIFLNHLRSIRSKNCFICTRESPDFAHSFQIRHIYAAKTLAPVFSLSCRFYGVACMHKIPQKNAQNEEEIIISCVHNERHKHIKKVYFRA